MTVKEIVAEYLKSKKYDGLVLPDAECGCSLDDFIPCGEISDECQAGYKHKDNRIYLNKDIQDDHH